MKNADGTEIDYGKIYFYLRPPKGPQQLTNSYNLIDVVIKTIRNMIGRVAKNNPLAFGDNDLMERVIEIYNNTVHSAFSNKYTPAQVQDDFKLEAQFIRGSLELTATIDKARLHAGYLNYEPGDFLMVHLPLEKTNYKFQRPRRNFEELAKSITYKSPNARVELLHPYPWESPKMHGFSRAIIPIYYTKLLAKTLYE
jgi:hypothetical protein